MTTATKPAYPTLEEVRERRAIVEQELTTAKASIPGVHRRLAAHNLAGARGTYDETTKLHSRIADLEIETDGLRQLEAQAEYRELIEADAAWALAVTQEIPARYAAMREEFLSHTRPQFETIEEAAEYQKRKNSLADLPYHQQCEIDGGKIGMQQRQDRQIELRKLFPDAITEINAH